MNAIALVLSAVLLSQAPPESETQRLWKELEKVKADNAVALRQLEVAKAQLKELNDKLAKASTDRSILAAETQYARQRAEKLSQDLGDLEKKHAQMAKDKSELAEKADALSRLSVEQAAKAALQKISPPPVATPAPAPTARPGVYRRSGPEAKITAVVNEGDLAVISIGSDQGVAEGQSFMVLREGTFIGTLKIDRVDRSWAAGKMSRKISEPKVGDGITAETPLVTAKTPIIQITPHFTPGSAVLSSTDELRQIRKELDDVRSQVRQLSDQIVPTWQGQGVSVEETPEELRAHLSILRGLLVRRVREGSPAEKAGLKANDVVPDLLEAQLLQAIETGMPIHVIRQGQRLRLPGAAGK